MIDELIKENRTFRRFYQEEEISLETLMELVNLGRLSASSGNLQPLKYICIHDREVNDQVFPFMGWGYRDSWMDENEQPSAYIVILGDTKITRHFSCDHGIAAQSIMLGARERGLGGCVVGAMKRDRLRELLRIPTRYTLLLVLALGKPKHKVVIKEMNEGESIRFWRDDEGTHYIPKRKLEDVIVNF